MKKRIVICCILLFSTAFVFKGNAEDLNRSSQVNQFQTQTTLLIQKQKAEIDSLHKKVQDLQYEKNTLLDKTRRLDEQRASMAAVMTLASLFFILFVFMYLSVRRRRKRESAEYEAKLKEAGK